MIPALLHSTPETDVDPITTLPPPHVLAVEISSLDSRRRLLRKLHAIAVQAVEHSERFSERPIAANNTVTDGEVTT